MVVLYYNVSSSSCRKAKSWFEKYEIEFIEKRVSNISKEDLLYALFLTKNGFSDLLKRTHQCDLTMKKKIEGIVSMSFNEGVDLLLKNPQLLKVPLIIAKDKLVIGYNSEEIRIFVPRGYRGLKRV